MPAADVQELPGAPNTTSASEKLLDVIANPIEAFEEVAASDAMPSNWRLPVLLVCLTNIILIGFSPFKSQSASVLHDLIQPAASPAPDIPALWSNFRLVSSLAICGAAFAGTFWFALVIWAIGRIFLNARFSYRKALEVAGLSGFVLALGAIFTVLLMAVLDNSAARPSLSILLVNPSASERALGVLDSFNLFYLWSVALMALGLSKLSATPFKESAFWVFGYWLALKVLLYLLS